MFLKNFLEYFIMSSSVKFPFEINLILNFKNFGSFRKGFFINLKTITFFLIENYFLHTKKNLIIRLLIGFNLPLTQRDQMIVELNKKVKCYNSKKHDSILLNEIIELRRAIKGVYYEF